MKAYLSIKFKEDHSNKELVEEICCTLKKFGIDAYVVARDFEKWGDVKNIEPDVLMAHTFNAIDESDILLVEFSEKGVGIGIEAGYAFAKRKPIIVIAKEGSEISATLQGIAKRIIFYKTVADLETEKRLLIGNQGVCFLIMRPDKTVLMQLRDSNSKRYKNMWCFPGGACDQGEEYIDTVVREVQEEYELTVEKEQCTFLMSRMLNKMHIYICAIDNDQQPVLHEGADMKWMNIDEIKKLPIGYNQGDIVVKLEKYIIKNK